MHEQGQVTLSIKDKAIQAEVKQRNKKGKSTGGLSPHNSNAKPARSYLGDALQLPGRTLLFLAQPWLEAEGAVEHLHVAGGGGLSALSVAIKNMMNNRRTVLYLNWRQTT